MLLIVIIIPPRNAITPATVATILFNNVIALSPGEYSYSLLHTEIWASYMKKNWRWPGIRLIRIFFSHNSTTSIGSRMKYDFSI